MALGSPEWLKNAMIYEVFPRNHGKKGGFDAIREDLERIKALGTDVLWLMPIHPIGKEGRKGGLGSPYAISDYRGINPEFGNEASFKRLIDATHQSGMKLMIDVVYNHTSPDSVLAKQHPEWFVKGPDGKVGRKFEEWWDVADLIYDDPKLWHYQIETLLMWARMGVDGFRCDVASLVPMEFWLKAREALQKERGEVLWLAETVHSAFAISMRERGYKCWSDGEILQAFDMSYDYDGFEVLDEYFAGHVSLSEYLRQVQVQGFMNPQHGYKMRFAENHDQPRAAAKHPDRLRLQNWTTFHSMLPGPFLVYAGQEFANPHIPTLFDADPILLDGPHSDYNPWLTKLIAVMKTAKQRHFCKVTEAAEGLVGIRWHDTLPPLPRSKDLEAKLAKPKTDILVLTNLESRFGVLGQKAMDALGYPKGIKGKDLLSGTTVELGPQSRIPFQPLVIELG